MRDASTRRGNAFGLAAAVTFGVSAPDRGGSVRTWTPGCWPPCCTSGRRCARTDAADPARSDRGGSLRRVDLRRLLALVLVGGVVAPVLLMLGLQRTGGLAGSLLLNLEGPFTVLIAVLVLREHLSRRSLVAGALVVGAAAALGAAPGSLQVEAHGIVLVAGACLAWAIDNNLTAQLVTSDPRLVVTVKVCAAGLVNLGIAMVRGVAVPSSGIVCAALALGAVSYGLSVLLDAYALRDVGAAREAALFATAPFAGAAFAVFVFGDELSGVTSVAMIVMAIGAVLLVTDQHAHEHRHAATIHDHGHRHDDGHHDHHPGDVVEGWHRHEHEHRSCSYTRMNTPLICTTATSTTTIAPRMPASNSQRAVRAGLPQARSLGRCSPSNADSAASSAASTRSGLRASGSARRPRR